MNRYEFTYHGTAFKRISKRAARHILQHEPKKDILILTNKMHPYSPWTNICIINGKYITENDYTFDKYINAYEYYNCDYERGYYATFYIQKEGKK